jgi:acetolactate synthase-1/2/3 large subunit
VTQLSGAQALALGLERMGTTRVYGIIGTSILGFFEGLYDFRDRIRYISCRHEQVAASMADAEGRLTGRPGVAVVHSGPGALNAMVSVGNAYKDCSPLILVTGAVKSRLQGTDGMLEADHLRIFAPFLKGGYRLQRAGDAPEILSAAYRACLTGAWGPALIEVPEDVWKERAEVDESAYRFERPEAPRPDPAALGEILAALQRAKRPLILAGCGVAYAGAAEGLRVFAERLRVPVITTGNGRGILPEDHPLSLGRAGFGGGTPPADHAFQRADVILGIGCGISDMVTYEFTQETDADLYLINLDPEAGKRKFYVEKNLLADAGHALEALNRIAAEKGIGPLADWSAERREGESQWREMLAAAAAPREPLSPSYALSRLDALLPRDAIVAGGAGMHVLYANNHLLARGPLQFLASVNFGAMGFGLPAAMGAKISLPGRVVVAVLGDGDFLMTVQDLETAVREKIGIKIVVINDNSYRVLEMKQKLQYQGRVLGTRHGNPDLVKLAEAFGIRARRLGAPAEVEGVWQEMLATPDPFLVEIPTGADDLPPTNIEAVLKMGQQ